MERDEDEEREKETAREGWEGREKGREGKRDRKQYLELLEVVEDLHSVLGAEQGVLLQVPVDVHKRALVVHEPPRNGGGGLAACIRLGI